MSKNLYLVVAAVLVGFYFLQTFTPSLSEEELEAHKQASLDYLAANQFMGGVKVTESGLQYEVLQSGSGTVHPKVLVLSPVVSQLPLVLDVLLLVGKRDYR